MILLSNHVSVALKIHTGTNGRQRNPPTLAARTPVAVVGMEKIRPATNGRQRNPPTLAARTPVAVVGMEMVPGSKENRVVSG